MARSTDAACPCCRIIVLVASGLCALLQPACSRREEIRSYEAPKQNAGDSLAAFEYSDDRDVLNYDTPEGWMPGEAKGIRKAAFQVQDGERQVEVTVIDLAAAAGQLLPNVNIWRRQVQLGETTQEELDKAVRKMQIGGVDAAFVELVGPPEAEPREAILVAVAIHGGRAWFIKLMGDAELAQREKERFETFLKSVTFDARDGAGDGR